jgi:uncharacterized protein YhaN
VKISQIQIGSFGVWQGLTLANLDPGITVFYGENEAGKTTLLQYLRTILYGFSPERRSRYLPTLYGGRPGGELSVTSASGRFRIERFTQVAATDRGRVNVIAADGTVFTEPQLKALLGGVDEVVYDNVFAVGLRELQELATLDETDASQLLYDLSSGLDRVSLVKVTRNLDASREEILGNDDAEITRLLAEHEQLRVEVDQLRAGANSWLQAAAQRAATEREIEDLQSETQQIEDETKTLELARAVRSPWQKRETIDERLAAIGEIRELPEHLPRQLDHLTGQMRKCRAQAKQIKASRRRLVAELNDLVLNERLWRQAPRIEALAEQRTWLASITDQAQRLKKEIADLENDLKNRHANSGMGELQLAGGPRLSESLRASLTGPAKSVRDQSRRRKEAQRDLEQFTRDADELQESLEEELARRGVRRLTDALSSAGDRVAQLRRRNVDGERIAKLKHQRIELKHQGQRLLEQQVLSGWVIGGLGLMFSFGVLLVLMAMTASLFSISGTAAGILALLGVCAVGGSIIWKLVLQHDAAMRLEECSRQMSQVDAELEQAGHSVDDRTASNATGSGDSSEQLFSAERDLERLEQLVPMESEHQNLRQQAASAKRRLEESEEGYRSAMRRWKSALVDNGLPQTMSPAQVLRLVSSSTPMMEAQRRIDSRYEELEQRHREIAAIQGRVQQMAADAGLELEGDDSDSHIEQLVGELREQERKGARRDQLRDKHGRLKQAYNRRKRVYRKMLRRRDKIVSEAGAADVRQFRDLFSKIESVVQLREQRDELTEAIREKLGHGVAETAVATHVTGATDEQIEHRQDQLLVKYDATQDRLKTLYEQRGAMREQAEAMRDNRRLAEAQFELGCVEQRLSEAIQRWRVLAVASLALLEVRQTYERDRQPKTLNEASNYMSRLTEGQYVRIWTPLSEDVLKVEDRTGVSLPIDVLSQGTREQVFLSLRLALVAGYMRRGVQLPVVLDDVLVNFDVRRARAAAKLLADFAHRGHQLLIFSCHEHIMEIFQSLGVTVHELPSHAVVAGVEKPEPIVVGSEPVLVEEQEPDEPEEEVNEEDELEEEEELVAEEEGEYEEEYEEDEVEEVSEEDELETEEEGDEEYELAPIAEAEAEDEEVDSDENEWFADDEFEDDKVEAADDSEKAIGTEINLDDDFENIWEEEEKDDAA